MFPHIYYHNIYECLLKREKTSIDCFFSIYAVHPRLPQRILLNDNIIYKLGFFFLRKKESCYCRAVISATQEAETGVRVWGLPELYSEFKAILDNLKRPCLQAKSEMTLGLSLITESLLSRIFKKYIKLVAFFHVLTASSEYYLYYKHA